MGIDTQQAKKPPDQADETGSISSNEEEMEGEGGNDTSRIRLFPASHAGPYTIFVRQILKPLRPLSHSIFVNKKYKSTVSAEHTRDKMKFVLSDRNEANSLIKDVEFNEYRVFIKADEVEVDGVIKYDDLCDIESLSELTTCGKGLLGSPDRYAKIIDFHRFSSKAEGTEVMSNDVKVTFEGRDLPSHILIGGLRIRVRPWFQRAMFCDKCQQFQHTSKFCTRKKKCARCFGEHLTNECKSVDVDHSLCPYCNLGHVPGKTDCTYFQKVNSDFFKVQKARQAKPMAPVTVPMAPPSSSDAEFPPIRVRNSTESGHSPLVPLVVSNMFQPLTQEDITDTVPLSFKPKRPRKLPFSNPWAAGSSNDPSDPLSRRRMPAKRKAGDYISGPGCQSIPTQAPNRPAPSQHASPPGFQRSTSPVAKIATDLIIKISSTLGLSEHWMSIIKSIAPMIIDAILSFVSSSSSASAASNSTNVCNA